MDENEVFKSTTSFPSFSCFDSELKPRRATVAGDLTMGLQPCFSTGDLPSLVEQEANRKFRPKSFFPVRGGGAMSWQLFQRSDSSDSSDDLLDTDIHEPTSTADAEQSSLNFFLFLDFYKSECAYD